MPVAMRNLALPALSLLLACGGTPEGSRPTTVAPATEPAAELEGLVAAAVELARAT